MRDRYHSLVLTIATGAMLACGDAAVGDVTAPPLAATPAPPVADNWPTVDEITSAGITNAIGIQITLDPRFENNNTEFVVDARVRFQWANEVSATARAWVINRAGTTLNSGSAGMGYKRFGLPVSSGDTTFTVRISTNGFTCDLTGKSSGEGTARVNAIDAKLIQILLWEQTAPTTTGPDVLQPTCNTEVPGDCDAPASRVVAGATGILASESSDCEDSSAPTGGGGTTVEVCYTVWREYWWYDLYTGEYELYAVLPIGTYCETVTY
jgi:hypothetical protein